MTRRALSLFPALLLASCAPSTVDQFLSLRAPVVALTHMTVIDGTGAPARNGQTLVIERGRIRTLGNATSVRLPPGAHVLDLRGRTVMPGLVGMHDHLFYQMGDSGWTTSSQASFAKLYLASGVTTIRTAGTFDFKEDLRIKRLIDTGAQPGPSIHVTAPYLNAGRGAPNPARVASDVASWADQGATSFKAYTSLRQAELKAAIQAAHERGLKITGHLCAVGFQDAARLGIDNLEHGLLVDTEFYSGKRPDECPDAGTSLGELMYMDVGSAPIRQTISELVRHGVAITSTLAIFETFASRTSLDPRTLSVLAPRLQDDYRAESAKRIRAASASRRLWVTLLKKEMEFERAFVAAGGRLMAGVDPTGWGGIVAGFGDQRQVELLVEAGFSPEAAIQVATANGATFLGEWDRIGTVAVGGQADLVVVRGSPSAKISDIRNVELVFRNGVAYDPAKLIAAAQGTVGRLDVGHFVRSPINLLVCGLISVIALRRFWRRPRTLRSSTAPSTAPV